MGQNSGGSLSLGAANATGFVAETGIYCAYTCLFFAALPGMTSARRLKDPHNARSAWVFLIFSILMYVVATIYLILSGLCFYNSTFLNGNPNGASSDPININISEHLWLIILFAVQSCLGDALVIYRCYFVWDGNLWFVLVPICLLLASIVIYIFGIWYWIHDPFSIAPKLGIELFACIYPLAFVQNFMTTSLIILKIFLQHRTSKKAGIVHMGSSLSLIRLVRIVIESAAIYTIELFVLIILYSLNDNGQFMVEAAVPPSIGVTFVLLAIRIQSSRTVNATLRTDLGITSTLIPRWVHSTERESDFVSEDHRDHGMPPAADGTEMIDVQKRDPLQGDSAMDTELSSKSAQRSRTAALTV